MLGTKLDVRPFLERVSRELEQMNRDRTRPVSSCDGIALPCARKRFEFHPFIRPSFWSSASIAEARFSKRFDLQQWRPA